jgi:hypothetical protein
MPVGSRTAWPIQLRPWRVPLQRGNQRRKKRMTHGFLWLGFLPPWLSPSVAGSVISGPSCAGVLPVPNVVACTSPAILHAKPAKPHKDRVVKPCIVVTAIIPRPALIQSAEDQIRDQVVSEAAVPAVVVPRGVGNGGRRFDALALVTRLRT